MNTALAYSTGIESAAYQQQELALVGSVNMFLPAGNMYIDCATSTIIDSGFSFFPTDWTFHIIYSLRYTFLGWYEFYTTNLPSPLVRLVRAILAARFIITLGSYGIFFIALATSRSRLHVIFFCTCAATDMR